MVLDADGREQAYVEDCEVCCRPLLIRYTVVVEDGREKVAGFSVEAS